jgi:DNA-binding MarR family transcriptional regulator
MDYPALAAALLENMQALRKAKPQKHIDESLHGEAFVLHFIAEHGGDVLPGEISGEMGVSSARIAAALNSLESKGLITRQIDLSDRRKILVGITPEGKAQARQQKQAVVAHTVKMLAMLGEQDAKEHVRIMGRLAEIMAAHDIEPF